MYQRCVFLFFKQFTEKELRLDSFLKGSYDDAKNNIILLFGLMQCVYMV